MPSVSLWSPEVPSEAAANGRPMAMETILDTGDFQLCWENSASFLHLLFQSGQHPEPVALALDARERQIFLDLMRHTQRIHAQPLEHPIRLGALPGRPTRIRLALAPGPKILCEAVAAGRQLFAVELEARSTIRALIHLLTQPSASSCRHVEEELLEVDGPRVRLGISGWAEWDEGFSHVLGPDGEWLPIGELPLPLPVQGWLDDGGCCQRLSLEQDRNSRFETPAQEADRLAWSGLYEQAREAYDRAAQENVNEAKLSLGRAYLAVQRGPLVEALPWLEKARELAANLSEPDENLLLELETYLLCQQGQAQVAAIAQNMQKLVARQVTQDRWAARRALSNWRVFLDLAYDDQVPPLPLQVWQGWLAQLQGPLLVPTLAFARPEAWGAERTRVKPAPAAVRTATARSLPPERSLVLPLLAISLALLAGFWWRWKHPVRWAPVNAPAAGSSPR